MSIATVVTRGYGTFGDIAHVVTIGYGIGTVNPILIDTHDGGPKKKRGETKRDEKKRWEEYREERTALRNKILDAVELITGEPKLPEPQEIPALAKIAHAKPKATRKEAVRAVAQVRVWEAEYRLYEQYMMQIEEDDIAAIMALL